VTSHVACIGGAETDFMNDHVMNSDISEIPEKFPASGMSPVNA